ncbi:hypothetical protein X946_5948 [Burkholderia sp. ABCPW 111]|nr:hypothetical protein X946_5948 [Burkholderia sp. ABCPW 111]
MYASASCRRIITASAKPRSSMISATMMYITPSFLWSTVVSHSDHSHFQRFVQVSVPRIPSTTSAMNAAAPMMIG